MTHCDNRHNSVNTPATQLSKISWGQKLTFQNEVLLILFLMYQAQGDLHGDGPDDDDDVDDYDEQEELEGEGFIEDPYDGDDDDQLQYQVIITIFFYIAFFQTCACSKHFTNPASVN